MEPVAERHPSTFEQEVLWSVLDQDSLQHLLICAKNYWKIDSEEALEVLWKLMSDGCFALYEYDENNVPVEVFAEKLSPDYQGDRFLTFFEPTEKTFARLREIGIAQ
ncbi:MAG: hypothetical protein P4L53_27705 [Candidatus Obscuribacterales bacterium]|nr:hypothetical protein [Candidatus Obscuribacterales bacterium]